MAAAAGSCRAAAEQSCRAELPSCRPQLPPCEIGKVLIDSRRFKAEVSSSSSLLLLRTPVYPVADNKDFCQGKKKGDPLRRFMGQVPYFSFLTLLGGAPPRLHAGEN